MSSKSSRKRASRITIDIDHPSRLQLLKTYFNAKAVFQNLEAKETGNGFHFRIHQFCPDIEKNLDVRRHLGDDPGRLCFDENRKVLLPNWVDTSFHAKLKGGKLTSEQSCNVLSLPFTDRFPARKGGNKTLHQDINRVIG